MIPVLTYHRIADEECCVSIDSFRRQLDYLKKNNYIPINVRTYLDCIYKKIAVPRRAVLLTFDDGFEDNLTNAAPILKEYGFPAVVFVISDWIGKMNDWEDFPGKVPAKTMSVDQLKAWIDCGLEIGSHTSNHKKLNKLDKQEQWLEISESKKKLETLLGVQIDTIAYPYGDFDTTTAELAELAGYLAGFAIYKHTKPWKLEKWALPRFIIFEKWGIGDLKKLAYRISWRYRLVASINLFLKSIRARKENCE